MSVDIWNRQLVPQGRVELPSGENTLAEQFGKGLQGLGQAGAGLAQDVAQANRITEERAWQAEQPKVAQAIAEANAASAQDIDNIKTGLPADLSGYQEQVGKYWDTKKADLFKSFSSPRAQQYIDLQLTGYKGSDIAAAVRDTTSAKIQVRGDSIQAVMDLGANTLASRPDQYGVTMANVMATIDAQKGAVPEAKLNEWRTGAEQNLTAAMIGGQIERNAPQALKMLNSGAYDDKLDPRSKATMVNQAQAVIKADAAQAQAAYRQQQQILKSNVASRIDDYNTSVLNNGGVPPMVGGKPLVTPEQVRSAYADDPVHGEYLVQQMDKNQQIGTFTVETKSTTLEQDQARLTAMSPKPGEVFTGDQADKLKAAQTIIQNKWEAASKGVSEDLKDFQNGEQEKVYRSFDDWNQTAFTKGIPDGAQEAIYNAYGNTAKADETWGKLKQSEALGELQRKAAKGTLDQSNALYQQAAAEASAGGTGSAYAADQAKLLKQVLDEKVKALSESPAAFVVGDSGPLKSKWDAFAEAQKKAQAAPNDPAAQNAASAAGKAASAATIAEQVRLGVPDYQAQAIPESLAKEYAYNIQNAPPEQRPAIAQEIMNLGPSALGQVIKQGAPQSIAAYASVADDPIWTGQLAQFEKLAGSDVEGILKTRGVKRSDLDDRVSSEFAKIAGTIPPSSQPGYRDSVTGVTVMNVARGIPLNDAVRAAMAPYTRGSNISGSLRIPTQWSQPDTERGLQSIMAGVALGTVPVKAIPSGLPGSTLETDLQAIKEAARNGGLTWMTNENSTAAILVLPTGRFLETPDGKRFEIPFPDAQAKGRNNPKPGLLDQIGNAGAEGQ